MKKIAFVLAAAGLMTVAACSETKKTEANVDAMAADLSNDADNMVAKADAMTNATAADAMNTASAAAVNTAGTAANKLNTAADKIRAEAMNATK